MSDIVNELNAQYQALDSSYQQGWRSHHKDISLAFDPGRQRFDIGSTNQKRNYNSEIIDPSVTFANRTLSAGLFAGVTNPTLPWVKLQTDDEDLNEYHSVKVYLDKVSKMILYILARSNFYNVAPSVYSDIGLYSTSNMMIESDTQTGVRFYHNPVGTYRIANGSRNDVTSWTRELRMSSSQMVERFGIDNVSNTVKTAYQNSDYKTLFPVRHLIMPRELYNPNKEDNKNMPFKSVWWEPSESGKMLRESGFKTFPGVTPRWEVVGNDAYGSFAPGMLALGTARGLQKNKRTMFEGQDKMVNPPLNVPAALRNDRANLVPGGINYIPNAGGAKVESVFNVNLPLNEMRSNILDDRQVLNQAFFVDLFLMISGDDRTGRTATEIAERQGEKLLMLGPVLNRLTEEFLDPVIARVFDELSRFNILPEAPPELEGADIRMEYTSPLYQAQKLTEIAPIERVVSFAGNLAGVMPQVIDKLNADAIIDEYTKITGANPLILNEEKQVQAIRQQKQQKMQADQLGQAAQPMSQYAQAAELLSKTDVQSQSALTNMMSNLQGG